MALPGESVVNTVHNLSVSGPGTIKASTEGDACVFCHTAHRSTGQTPLWNHSMSGVTNYVVYSSPTLKAVVGQPNGSSQLCSQLPRWHSGAGQRQQFYHAHSNAKRRHNNARRLR